MRTPKKRKKRAEKISIAVIVIALVFAMGVYIVQLKQQNEERVGQLEKLQQEYEQETQRAQELADKEAYMQTNQYIEDMAQSKLGLVYQNEIIFKEKEK